MGFRHLEWAIMLLYLSLKSINTFQILDLFFTFLFLYLVFNFCCIYSFYFTRTNIISFLYLLVSYIFLACSTLLVLECLTLLCWGLLLCYNALFYVSLKRFKQLIDNFCVFFSNSCIPCSDFIEIAFQSVL